MYVLTRKQYRRVLKLMLTCRCKERIDQVKPLINHRWEKMSTNISIDFDQVIIFIENWSLWGALAGDWSAMSASSVGASFFAQRRARNASDWRRNAGGPREGETRLISSLLPAFLHAQAFIERERERDAWVQGRVGEVLNCTMGLDCAYGIFDPVVSCATTQ